MYFIHIVLNWELESKKWIFTNFVVGEDVLYVCVLEFGRGEITEETESAEV